VTQNSSVTTPVQIYFEGLLLTFSLLQRHRHDVRGAGQCPPPETLIMCRGATPVLRELG
jgi:hypothetical protein